MIQLKAPVELGLFGNLECSWSMFNPSFYRVSADDCYWEDRNKSEDSFLVPFYLFNFSYPTQ